MPVLDDILAGRLQQLDAQALRRVPREGWRQAGAEIIRDGRRLVSFSCNDYLGLSHHPEVIAAAVEATQTYGTGAGASRLVTGEHPLYAALEQALADWKGTEAACIFGSGYLANIGAITALMGKDDMIIADRLAHACMIDGAQLSGTIFKRFAHNDMAHLEKILLSERKHHTHCLIVTESVFSMDGDRAPLEDIIALARTHEAWVLVDGAHELSARHSCESRNPAQPSPDSSLRGNDGVIWIGTLSKALGSYGGYVCGSRVLADYLKTTARSLIYTTGLPPAVIAVALASVKILVKEPERAALPLKKAQLFTALAGLQPAQSAIVPVIIGEAEAALCMSQQLEAEGFLVSAIRPPTVPPGTSRLRLAFSAMHRDEDIERLAALVSRLQP